MGGPQSNESRNNSNTGRPTYLATANTIQGTNRYMDNGASSHIINAATNIEQVIKNYGKESNVVGNGEKVTMCKTSASSLFFENKKS